MAASNVAVPGVLSASGGSVGGGGSAAGGALIELDSPLELDTVPESRREADFAGPRSAAPGGVASSAAAAPAGGVWPEAVSRGHYVRRRELLDADRPMWWKERMAQRTLAKLGWGARIATVLLYGAAWFWLFMAFIYSIDWKLSYGTHRWESPIMIFTAGGAPTFACFAMLLVAARAAGSITAEREQDTWISLITTPLEAREIVRAKMLGAAFSVRYWYVLIAASWGCCLLLHPTLLWVAPVIVFVYGLGLVFAATVGIFFSLRSHTSIKAMGSALATLVFGAGIAPLIVAMLCQAAAPTAFSLPVVIAMPHFAAIDLMESSGRDTWRSGYVVFVFVATIGYLFVTLGLYSTCLGRFDELVGRVAARPRARPAGEPSGAGEAAGSRPA
jgi:ABC-type transport system involved in multi-copper enzyme maturation permease subunit